MNATRKVELVTGVATAVLAAGVTLLALRTHYLITVRLQEEFMLVEDLLLGAVRFVLPGLLVALGSYIHAVKDSAGVGRGLLVLGTVFLSGMFVINVFISVAFWQADLWFWLNLLLPVFAIATSIVSFLVRESRNRGPGSPFFRRTIRLSRGGER